MTQPSHVQVAFHIKSESVELRGSSTFDTHSSSTILISKPNRNRISRGGMAFMVAATAVVVDGETIIYDTHFQLVNVVSS